jgi:hypothetical protein
MGSLVRKLSSPAQLGFARVSKGTSFHSIFFIFILFFLCFHPSFLVIPSLYNHFFSFKLLLPFLSFTDHFLFFVFLWFNRVLCSWNSFLSKFVDDHPYYKSVLMHAFLPKFSSGRGSNFLIESLCRS